MAEEVIGLLFGVEGVGVNGASGQEIVKGLTQIVNEINSGKSTVPKIKFHFDTTEATKAVDDLKAKLKDIEKIASIKVTYSNGKGGKGGGGSLTQELKKEMSEALALQRKISGTKVTIGKLELEGGNANQIAEYTSQLERLEEQYSQLMQTFMKKVTGNAGDIMFDDIKSFSDQYANLGQIADDTLAVARAKEADIQAASAQKQKYDELSATIKKWVQASKQGAKLAAEYSTVTRQADGTIVGSTEGYEKTIAAINSVNNAMKELRITFDDKGQPIKPDAEEFARIAAEIGITEEQYQKLFTQVQSGSVAVEQSVQNANRKNDQSWTATASKIRDEVQRMYDTIAKDPNARKMADEIIRYSKSATGSVGELKNKYDELRNVIHESGADIETWGDKFKKTFAGKVRSALAAAVTAVFTKYLREIYQNVVNIDKALVNLQIASGKTREETKRLIKEYAALAKQLGATTIEVAEAADTWLRQGYSAEEANTLITNSIMLSKLGQMESAEASRALTSAMKGYGVAVNESIGIVDKLTKVDMEAAASAGDIATAMAETATSAKLSGVSMDKLIGYIATVKEVTQDGSESVGVFFKTLFARMNNVKAGKFIDDETGESLNDVESVLHKLGIELRGANDEFRNSSDVLSEVAGRWDEFNDTERNAIATAMAGSRQFEKFNTLMTNYGTAMEYAKTSTESAGTAMEKYEVYAEGIEGKMNSLKVTFEELSTTILSSDWLITGIEVLSGLLTVLNGILSFGDSFLVKAALVIGVVYLAIAAYGKLKGVFLAAKLNIKELIALQMALAGSQATATTTTHALTAALIKYSSTGLLGIITLIPRAIIVTGVWIASMLSAKTATLSFKAALDLLNVHPVMLTITAVVLAIVGAVAAINKFANAAAEASAEAKEHAKAMKEAADKAKEEQQALDDLIDKYEELKSKGTVDADTRKEIRDVQKQINLLVKGEVAEWDMVNGSLDENLKKLKQYRAEMAGESLKAYQQSYSAAQTSSNLAHESDRSDSGWWAEWATNLIGIDIVVDGWDKEAAAILNSVDGVTAAWGSNLFSTLTNIVFDADGAEEYVDRITAAMNALEDDMNYDHLHSEVYQRLLSLKSVYETYTTTTIEAVDQLLEPVVKYFGATLEANGEEINSLEDYEKFKQSMIDAAMSSEYLKDALASQAVTQQTVTEAVNDYMATNYADLYDKFTNISKGATVALKTINDVFDETQEGFDGLVSAMSDVTSEGYLTADALASLAKLEKENALGGLTLAEILTQDANGYKLASNALEQYITKVIEAVKAQYAAITAFATAQDKQNALDNIDTYIGVLSALIATTEDSVDASKAQREALKAEQETYENQRDAFEELIDIRKELLQTYADEVSYQRELEKKQRAVSSLQQKLSVARLDGSAAGQARVRELEAELQEAQDDLNDFTLEHAIDVLTAQLEAEAVENEAFFQQHLDRIEGLLEGLDTSPEVNVNIDTSWASTLLSGLNDVKTKLDGLSVSNDGTTTDDTGGDPGNGVSKTRWTSYQDAADAGYSNIRTRSEFGRGNNSDKQKYGTYQAYLDGMYEKYMGKAPVYHTGGFVGDVSALASNEEFAKLLKGEFVSTPAQMKRFMEETLPKIANYSATGGSNEFNAPLIEITCESVTTEALPELERIVNEAVKEIKRELDSGMSRTGFKRTPTKRLT